MFEHSSGTVAVMCKLVAVLF